MERSIHISSINDSPAICFETGLDPRAFARTKMSQSLIEEGYIVNPDGSHEIWRPSGVNETNNVMRVWGPAFQGKRLDILLNEACFSVNTANAANAAQAALQALVFWMRAKMCMGDKRSVLNPSAAFINPNGSVFFAPEHLSNRCLFLEGIELDRYNCHDLVGMDISAFCAGVMLYQLFTGVHPFPSKEIYQDMREGIFLPLHLAAPNLDNKLAGLIQSALMLPVAKKRPEKSGTDIISNLLELLLSKENKITAISSVLNKTAPVKSEQIEKEKKLYLLKQNTFIKAKRFAHGNKPLLAGISIGLIFIAFIMITTAQGMSRRPTTAGLTSRQVVTAYYEAFSNLNHQFMEAAIQGASKVDLNAATSLFAIVKTRQAYEAGQRSSIFPARVWRESGGELPSPSAFGVTDLTVDYAGGSEENRLIVYRTEYLLWTPDENFARNRSDILTLRLDKNRNWRIIEIIRTER